MENDTYRKPDADKFEYKIEEFVKGRTFEEIQDALNSSGNEGWELCACEYGAFIFKRRL